MLARVASANAEAVDRHIYDLIVSELDEHFHRLHALRIDFDAFRPSIELALNTIIWYYSVHSAKATLGQKVLRLGLVDAVNRESISKTQSIGYFLADVLTPWILNRVSRRSPNRSGTLDRLQQAYRCANLLNFLLFLRKGVYLKLWHRWMSIAVSMSQPDMFNHHNYEFMNEQLLFFAASEFIAFVFPLLNMPLVRNTLRIQFNRLSKSTIVQSLPFISTPSVSSTMKSNASSSNFPECALCKQIAFNPHQIGCAHVFCYFCIRHAFDQDPYNGFTCFDCDHNIIHSKQIKQLSYSCI